MTSFNDKSLEERIKELLKYEWTAKLYDEGYKDGVEDVLRHITDLKAEVDSDIEYNKRFKKALENVGKESKMEYEIVCARLEALKKCRELL